MMCVTKNCAFVSDLGSMKRPPNPQDLTDLDNIGNRETSTNNYVCPPLQAYSSKSCKW